MAVYRYIRARFEIRLRRGPATSMFPFYRKPFDLVVEEGELLKDAWDRLFGSEYERTEAPPLVVQEPDHVPR